MSPQEIIISASSSEASGSAINKVAATSAPAIIAHDLLTASHLHSYKTCTTASASTSYVPSRRGVGGTLFSVQEGKALLNVWAWQKDQMHIKIHLPEKMSCFAVSPNGCWAVGGSPTGQVYLWENASGLLLTSFTAHYRAITTLTFSSDSHLLLSSSLDSGIHVYLVSRLVDGDDTAVAGKPYGVLNDHTLAVRDVRLGKTAGSHGGRCWTASDDGTVKVWSLHPPFDLLSTFSLPGSSIPSTLAVDASERFFYVGTSSGDVHLVPLFKHRDVVGGSAIEAVGGGGQGSASIRADASIISHQSPITALSLSLSSTHLLIGTSAGEIHMHALPSHQLLRTISTHTSNGAITHLSTLLRPADFIGSSGVSAITSAGSSGRGGLADNWPIMEVKSYERIRAGGQSKENRDVPIALGGIGEVGLLDSLRIHAGGVVDGMGSGSGSGIVGAEYGSESGGQADTASQIAALESETKRLRASLERAIKVNDTMWKGVVQMKLAEDAQ